MLINVKILPQIEESLIPPNCVRQPGCPSYLVAPFLWVGVFHFWDVQYLSGSQAPKMQFWMEKYFEVSQPKPLADDSPFHSSRVIVVQPNKYYNKIKSHFHKLITTASCNDTLWCDRVFHIWTWTNLFARYYLRPPVYTICDEDGPSNVCIPSYIILHSILIMVVMNTII